MTDVDPVPHDLPEGVTEQDLDKGPDLNDGPKRTRKPVIDIPEDGPKIDIPEEEA